MKENFNNADDAPEWTDADFERAEIRAGGKVVRPMAQSEPTIFAVCAEAAYDAPQAQSKGMELHHVVARDVIQAIIDRTPSPATVQELTRILREGGVDVPEATFD